MAEMGCGYSNKKQIINNMAQQTAVEWLVNKIYMVIPNEERNFLEGLKQQAKQMEKEQISKAWDDGDYAYFDSKETGRDFDNGEQYYNETYMTNKNNNDK